MSKGLVRSQNRAHPVEAPIRKEVIPVEKTISVAGSTGDGWGTVVIGDLPQGNLLFLGAVAYMTFDGTDSTATALDATWAGDFAVGTAPADDSTPTGTQANLVALSAIGAATTRVSPRTRATTAAAGVAVLLDNTDGAMEINLQLLIDNANISGPVDLVAEGELHLAYIILGDD